MFADPKTKELHTSVRGTEPRKGNWGASTWRDGIQDASIAVTGQTASRGRSLAKV
jgi:hypothetical protein